MTTISSAEKLKRKNTRHKRITGIILSFDILLVLVILIEVIMMVINAIK